MRLLPHRVGLAVDLEAAKLQDLAAGVLEGFRALSLGFGVLAVFWLWLCGKGLCVVSVETPNPSRITAILAAGFGVGFLKPCRACTRTGQRCLLQASAVSRQAKHCEQSRPASPHDKPLS